jgi:hypothetical protein
MVLLVKSSTVTQSSGMERPLKRAAAMLRGR